ncbi:MAG TPA: hypothetical protein VGR78_16920 [Verrucomicrobiae bacterium]|nr:hypothetical protein [Verrucomicrobiae bacterium]
MKLIRLKARRTLTAAMVAGLATLACQTHAQQLAPAWEYLINKPGVPIPVLTNTVTYTTDSDNGDGMSTMDSLGALMRYDTKRLLLGIRENGINEAEAGPGQTLAAQYPDRSLIWINPTNGAPMGIALTIGLTPVPLDADFIAAGGTPDQYWWTYTVAADGSIYTGYKNKIIRYSQNGSGGISPTPYAVFTLSSNEVSNRGIDPTLWAGWRWARLAVTGTGTNTIILAGASAGNRGNFLLTTTDGTNFVAGSRLGVGGATSTPILSHDPNTPSDLWDYAGIYPGNSNGADSSYSRYTTTPPFTDDFTRDSSFNPPADPFTYNVKFRNDFIGGLDANQDLNYIAVYSTPTWNSRAVVGNPRPAWLALVGENGRFLSARKIDITEDAELLSTDQASLFQGTIGFVSLNKLSTGEVEVLWSGTIYGYGRYLVQPYGPEPVAPDGGVLPGPFPGNTAGAANWVASSEGDFTGNVSINQEGQGPIPWSVSRYNRGDFAVRLSPADPTAAQDNFDILQDFPGEGTAAIPSEQAWIPNAEAGIIIPTVRTNGPIDWNDTQGPFYPVIAASVGGSSGYGYDMVTGAFTKGGTDVQTGKAGDQSSTPSPEGNFDFATTWFPYNQGWIGAAVNNPDASGNTTFASTNAHSPGLTTNIVTWTGTNGSPGGSAVLSLPGVNSANDGMIFATSTQGGSDVKIISLAPKTDGSGWIMNPRRASESDPTALDAADSQFQFVYIPYNSSNLIGGYISSNGTPIKSTGNFSITRTAAGTYSLTIPGQSGTNGVLLLQEAAFLPGSTNLTDNNFLSYQFTPAVNAGGTNGTFVVESRHAASGGTFPLTDTGFYFAWVDFKNPLAPVTQTQGSAPSLSITKSGNSAVITFSSSANGFTLEKTSALGPQTSWTPVGVVGQGNLAGGSYTVPLTANAEFYRLRK